MEVKALKNAFSERAFWLKVKLMTTSREPSIPSAKSLGEALQTMRGDALMMASLARRSFDNARRGLLGRDEDACNTVIVDDEEIDTLEVQLDQTGIALMLRFHPVASDLRNVITTMKFSINLERIADQTVNIARRTKRLINREPVEETAELEVLFGEADLMFRDAIRAFADSDAGLALSLKHRDRDLDRNTRDFGEKITTRMARDVENIPTYLDLIFITRYLERIGDQAKSIGEDTVYAISAEEVRHSPV
jgi:phosphate transport system protein